MPLDDSAPRGVAAVARRLTSRDPARRFRAMKLEFRRAHSTTVEALRARIDAQVGVYAARYPHLDVASHYRWTSPTSAEGSYRGADGKLSFDASHIAVALELPFFARPFKSKIEAFLEREFETITATA